MREVGEEGRLPLGARPGGLARGRAEGGGAKPDSTLSLEDLVGSLREDYSLYTILSLSLLPISNIVWCIAYKGRVERGSYMAQTSRNRIAVVWVTRMAAGFIKG